MLHAPAFLLDKQPIFTKEPNLYQVLGVSSGAMRQEVDRAYRSHLINDVEMDPCTHLAWKVLRDPFYAALYQKKLSLTCLYEAGFFVDKLSLEDVSVLEFAPGFLTTPFHKIQMRLEKRGGNQKQVVLLTTGGFSPIHNGHLSMMEVAKQEVEKRGYQVVGGYFSPSHDDYVSQKYGGEAELNSQHRIYLSQLAVHESDWLMVDPWESRYVPTDINFTDVISHLKQYLAYYLKQPALDIFYVFGSDNAMFARVFTDQGGCVCVARQHAVTGKVRNEKGIRNNARIIFTQHTTVDKLASSSEARKWKTSLMPDEVSDVYFRWRKNLLMAGEAADRPKRLYILRDEGAWAVEPWIQKLGYKRVMQAREVFRERLSHALHDVFLFPLLPDLPTEVDIRQYHLDEQKRYVEQLERKERILNLDVCTAHETFISASRQFSLCDGQLKARSLVERPGFPNLQRQIQAIKPGDYTLVDDDLATGSTMNMLMGMLPETVRVKKIRTLTDYSRKVYNHQNLGALDQEPFDMVDLRDFIIGARAGGLVVRLSNGRMARAPYIEPYVSLISRACIPPSSTMIFSKTLWELNEEFFSSLRDLRVKDMDPFGQKLFIFLQFPKNMLIQDLCRWHIERICLGEKWIA